MLNTIIKIVSLILLICTAGMVLVHSRVIWAIITGEDVELLDGQRCWFKGKKMD